MLMIERMAISLAIQEQEADGSDDSIGQRALGREDSEPAYWRSRVELKSNFNNGRRLSAAEDHVGRSLHVPSR